MARILRITALILAGEMIYGLPFHTQRFFRPTMLEAFDITNTQLGDMFAAYGLAAMFSYFLGGPFADRYSARSLIAVSLILTSLGGLYMATYPGVWQMTALYAFWGISTSLLFWAALIKATRDWGGTNSQGIAFGILDGGRGLAAAVFAAFSVGILILYIPNADLVTDAERKAGLRSIVLFYSLIGLLCSVIVWFLVPHEKTALSEKRSLFTGIPQVIRKPLIWAQAAVIICAYCGYKGLDNYSLYAVQVLNMNEIDAAKLSTYGAYVRPIACILAGIIADRFDSARSICAMFILLVAAYGFLAFATLDSTSLLVIYLNLFVTFFAVFALRGIYYALLEETNTPKHLTGASVAVIAFIGYTPEAFFAPIAGRILDANPGVSGHHNFFAFLAIIALSGVLITLLLLRLNKDRVSKELINKSTF
ncbi:MAG: MFS transporter [Woeseia sp.]|nr:MFS transporter [Woeseia sp.]|tara:strand:+ start:1506 stop:2771 length:1266 start_codon:yes stop_codon:yes gene_type:complete